ncbi:MAG: aldo/keto reductase [Oscillospiraceae bacterium]|nr:aldo/keto reductase [Oscillospiraceae bacterium]
MKYRKLGKTGIEVSEIGMGLEHLLPHSRSQIDETIKTAVDGGVSYFDCHPGHDYKPEQIEYAGFEKLGKALEQIREKVSLSYIAHGWTREAAEIKPRFEYFVKTLQTDYADVFMIQFCDKIRDYECITGESGLLEYAKNLRLKGAVRCIGIATHSSEVALKAVFCGDFDVIMYPVNPAFDVVVDGDEFDTENLDTLWSAAQSVKNIKKNNMQPRKRVYSECEKNGVGIIAMKPFGGGFMFKNEGFSPLNLIAYALTQNGVSSVVPGCQTPDEIKQVLSYYGASPEKLDFCGAVLNSRWSIKGNCQYCHHCLPCAADINIGFVNRMIDNKDAEGYGALAVGASSCLQCGECETRCPFEVNIREKMETAVKMFE